MSISDTIHEIVFLIDGKSCASESSKIRELMSPATGEVIGSIPEGTATDVDTAVKAAYRAFKEWSAKTAYERESIILKATDFTRTQADKIGLLMALEQGKPLKQCISEVKGSCDFIDYYAAEGVRVEGYSSPTEKANLRSWVIYQPVGVCGLITPWNYPVSLLSWKLGPALAAGCSCVVKPTTVTPLSPTAFCHALTEGGIPAGVLNVVSGKGSVVGEALVRHPLVKKVAMTGSTDTGKRLMKVYGPTLNKISLELGGHCPAVVCEDADLDLAAKMIAYKGFRNVGQSCSTIARVYVHASQQDALVEKLKQLAEAHTIGDGISDPDVDIGPMATADGVETVEQHIADAVEKGASLVYGGKKPEGEMYEKGNYFLPTILTGVTDNMLVMQEETFGPTVCFITYEDLEDAITGANNTSFGLVSYLFTRDLSLAVTVSERLEAGTICINNGAVNTPYGPYAGWKESGYGVELSRKAIFEYLNTKHIKFAV